jgi:hypothetical protein
LCEQIEFNNDYDFKVIRPRRLSNVCATWAFEILIGVTLHSVNRANGKH